MEAVYLLNCNKMHNYSKFESSGWQEPPGVTLILHDISKPREDLADNASERPLPFKEWQPKTYNITTLCHTCSVQVHVAVSASKEDILQLQTLFLNGLSFHCTNCANRDHGRR